MELLDHNKTAYEAVQKAFDNGNKTCVIHPTGTGKTYIALQAIKDCQGTCIYLTALRENLAYFERVMAKEIGEVKGYHSGIYFNINKEYDKYPLADLIILDEFHRCGAPEWEGGVKKLLLRNTEAKILGLSATPVRYLDNERNMADDLFSGNIASEITLASAIAQGLLRTPEYHGCIYSYNDDLERMERTIKNSPDKHSISKAKCFYEQAKRQIENSNGLKDVFDQHLKKNGKYIIFCRDKTHLKQMLIESIDWFRSIDKMVYKTFSGYSQSEKELYEFEHDREDRLRLLFCIDMLNEGTHISGVTGIIMLRPTESANVYFQQLGRALSVDSEGRPQIFDVVNNSSILIPAREIWAEINRELKEAGKQEITFDIFDRDVRIMELLKSFYDTIYASWYNTYELAEDYARAHGSIRDISLNYTTDTGIRLGSWVYRQRTARRTGHLSEDKIAFLDDIGMEWDPLEADWQEGYETLVRYKESGGDMTWIDKNVSMPSGRSLNTWINTQRKNFKILSDEKQKKLLETGLTLEPKADVWMMHFREVKEYAKDHDINALPRRLQTDYGYNLGSWFMNQKKKYRNPGTKMGALTEEQKECLDSLGIRWEDRYDRSFEEGYAHAKAYVDAGNSPKDLHWGYICDDGFKLGSWIHEKRRDKNKKHISKEQKAMLEALGFSLDKVFISQWNEWIEALRQYKAENKDVNSMPVYYETENGLKLGLWVSRLRLKQPDGTVKFDALNTEQKQALIALGFDPSFTRKHTFEERAEEVRELLISGKELSTFIGDKKTASGFVPGKWIRTMRLRLERGELSGQKEETLREILDLYERAKINADSANS